MAETNAQSAPEAKARQPYDPIPKPQMRTIDHCTRASDLVIPGMNKRIEDPDA